MGALLRFSPARDGGKAAAPGGVAAPRTILCSLRGLPGQDDAGVDVLITGSSRGGALVLHAFARLDALGRVCPLAGHQRAAVTDWAEDNRAQLGERFRLEGVSARIATTRSGG